MAHYIMNGIYFVLVLVLVLPFILSLYMLVDWIFGKKVVVLARVMNVKNRVWTDTLFGDEHIQGWTVLVRLIPDEPMSYRVVPEVHSSCCKEIDIDADSSLPEIGSVVTAMGWRSRLTGGMHLSKMT